jgi:hypothetical protein
MIQDKDERAAFKALAQEWVIELARIGGSS